MARAAQQWLDFLQEERKLAPSTIDTYKSSLTQAFRGVPVDFNTHELHKALDHRLRPPASAHVARATYTILNSFFVWWEQHGGIDNPLAFMAPPPKPDSRRTGLTSEELSLFAFRLMAADIKARCECMLMLHQGFRVGDVIALRVQDIDFRGARIRAAQRKGGLDQWLPMGPTMSDALAGYLDQYGISEGYAFTGPKGQMRPQAVWKCWKKVCGPDLNYLTPHQARHTFANQLLRGDAHADVHSVSRLMGHRNLRSTQLYLDDDQDAQRGAILTLDHQLAEWNA